MSKELYIATLERIAAIHRDRGMSEAKAYDLAGDQAYDAMREELFDMADMARLRKKDAA